MRLSDILRQTGDAYYSSALTRRLQRGLPESSYSRAEAYFADRVENMWLTKALRAEQAQLEQQKKDFAASNCDAFFNSDKLRQVEPIQQRPILERRREKQIYHSSNGRLNVNVSSPNVLKKDYANNNTFSTLQSSRPPPSITQELSQKSRSQQPLQSLALKYESSPRSTPIAHFDDNSSKRPRLASHLLKEKEDTNPAGSTNGPAIRETPLSSSTVRAPSTVSSRNDGHDTSSAPRARVFPLRDVGTQSTDNRPRILDRRRIRNEDMRRRLLVDKRQRHQQKTKPEKTQRANTPVPKIAPPFAKTSPGHERKQEID